MLYSKVIFFIAGRVTTALEKAAIEELKRLAPTVLLRAAKFCDGLHDKADAVAGTIPDAYAAHPVAPLESWTSGLLSELKATAEHLALDSVQAGVSALTDSWGAQRPPSAPAGWPSVN